MCTEEKKMKNSFKKVPIKPHNVPINKNLLFKNVIFFFLQILLVLLLKSIQLFPQVQVS